MAFALVHNYVILYCDFFAKNTRDTEAPAKVTTQTSDKPNETPKKQQLQKQTTSTPKPGRA